MTRDELVAELGDVRVEVEGYFSSLPLEEVYRRRGDAWAPVDDLRHITRSLTAVTRGLSLSPGELVHRFGPAEGPTRSRRTIGALALEGLAAGGRATPELSPEPVAEGDRTEAYRKRCLDAWNRAVATYATVLSAWPDEALDHHRFPHPFLGVFNLREWAHFVVLHSLHHVGVAERRLGRGTRNGA
ncbi:MAG TPA: DinB family protein [Longimicrobiales bacterium]|nr:DinB family protein [Longimicrobiales bacterium]